MELKDAAEVLVKKVSEWNDDRERLQGRLTELREQMETLEDGLDEDWEAFVESVQALLRAVDDGQEPLATEAEEAANAVAAIQTAVGEKLGEAAGELQGAERALDGVSEQAEALLPDLERMSQEAAQKPAEDVAEQLGEALLALKTSIEKAGEVLKSDFVQHMEQGGDLVDMLSAGCINIATADAARLDAAYVDWAGKLAEAGDEVHVEGFNKAEAHVTEVVDWSAAQYEMIQKGSLQQLAEAADTLEKELGALKTELIEKKDQLDDGVEDATEAFADLLAALERSNTALQEVHEVLLSYGYTG